MAIDWGRMARGVATGYLSAKIANTEANDKLNADIHKAAGINFHTNTYPEWQKKERVREREFKQIADFFGSTDVAHYFGDRGGITGEGNSLSLILETLKAKKLDPNQFIGKKWEGSTYEERYQHRLTDIQDAERIATGLSTGSSKIGPITVKSQLEGLGTDKAAVPDTDTGVESVGGMLPGGEKELSTDQSGIAEQQISQTKATGLSDMFAPAAREIDVETKYQQIGKAIQEQFGYAQSMQLEGDQVNLNFGGMNKKIHNAHLAITQMIMRKSNMNNYDAAAAAKGFLNEFTIKPFMELEKTLGGKYIEHYGQTTANMGTGPIDVTTQMVSDGVSLKEYIFQQIDLLPKNQLGHTDPAILDRFIQNIPDNFKIGTEKFKTQLENSQKMEARQFKLT